jgi:hypothetical protein
MIIEEGTVLILDNDARYYLAHEIGELEGYEGKYYFAVGVTKNEKLNADDIVFIKITEDDIGPLAERIKENTEEYSLLACLEITNVLMETVPGYRDKLITEIEKIEMLEESSK